MKIGIFSDIHDNIPHLIRAREVFEQEQIDLAIFCGDLSSPFTLKWLGEWPWTIKAVFGNNEGDKWGINRRINKYHLTNVEYPERGYIHEFVVENKKIFVFHGHLPEVTRLAVNSGEYDLVCTGHTHEPGIQTIGKSTWINPGSVTGVSENQAITQGSVAVFDTTNKEGKIVPIK